MELTERASEDTNSPQEENSVNSSLSRSTTISASKANHAKPFVYKTHSEQLFDTFSVQTLAQWILKNGLKVDKLLRRNEKTFIDNKGIKRYAHNWQPYEELSEEAEAEQLFEKTGCVRLNVEYQLRGKFTTAKSSKEVDMLNDWQRLWSFLHADEEDEIAIHAPLLRHLLEFCFHKRTCQIFFYLVGYSFVCYLIPVILYPDAIPLLQTVCNFLSLFFQLIVYLACLMLMKGKTIAFNYIFGSPSSSSIKNVPNHEMNNNVEEAEQYYSVHWTATFKQLYRCAKEEYNKFWHPTDTQAAISRAQSLKNSISFYRLLNMSLKLLTRYNQVDTKHSNFDRSSYRIILLFTVYVLPIYVFIYDNVFPSSYTLFYCVDSFYGHVCQSILLYAALTVGFLTRSTLQYIFAASVLVTLVSLAYAGEASFQLIHSWLKKFRSLRRVKLTDQTCKVVPFVAPVISSDAQKNKTTESTNINDTMVRSPLMNSSIVVDGDKLNEKIEEKIEENGEEKEEEEHWTFEDQSILDYVKRDATEHYLLIREIVNVSSEIWSPAMTGLFFIVVYSIFAFVVLFILYFYALNTFSFIIFGTYITVRVVILLVYPILSMSHANAYLYEIKGMFEKSALDDFLVLGGREHWIAFIDACPIVWTYYGIWVTYDRLQGILYTGFVGIVATVASLISASPFFAAAAAR